MTFQNWRWMSLATLVCVLCAFQARHQRQLGDLGFAMEAIEHAYVEPTHRYQLYQAAMSGVVQSLDQYSGYIKPDQYGSFQSQIHQEFGGLGIIIEPTESKQLEILTVLFDTPAFKAGLEAGDIIATIDGQKTDELEANQATERLRGKPGSKVRLEIRRSNRDELLPFEVERAIIQSQSVTGDRRRLNGEWEFLMEADPRIGFVRLEIFGEKTPNELRKALQSIGGQVSGVVLDLRDNSGGLLPTATDICDMFLDGGLIVATRGRRKSYASEHYATPGVELDNQVPLVVLINDQSASASEVTAACLQDYRRAVILGERSFGKGSVQNVIDIEGGQAALRLTSAYYFPPLGRNIHKRPNAKDTDEWGVMPDENFHVPLTTDQTKLVFERLRTRSQPKNSTKAKSLDTKSIEQAAQPDSKNEAHQLANQLARDPSLSQDPQLLRAVEYLVEKIQ
jgi:carboxyl-terminal processing protease